MEVRYFAGAVEAAGHDTETVDATGKNATELVAELGKGNDRLAKVLSVSSLLADGARVNDLDIDLSDVQRLDVLPPFAGG